MKKKYSNRDEMRNNAISVPLSADEKIRVKKNAKKIGVTMASYVRLKLFKVMEEDEKEM